VCCILSHCVAVSLPAVELQSEGYQQCDFGVAPVKRERKKSFSCLIYTCKTLQETQWCSGEGLKLEVETEYTESLYPVSSDVSRFEWESLAII